MSITIYALQINIIGAVVILMAEDKHKELEQSLKKMMQTTSTFDNFQKMMRTTRTFDEELNHRRKQAQKAISDAFAKMINLSYSLEHEGEQEIKKAESKASKSSIETANNDLLSKFISKLPAKYRHLPHAFKRNPKIVIKYFLGMIIGRILAIILYIVATFIPAIPVPESISGWIGKPLKAVGSTVVSMRGFISDPATIINVITNIPTDINKLLQKIGEFFQFYGRRAWAFIIRTVRHPRLAYEDLTKWSRENAKFLVRLCRSAAALTCSFIMIKLAMIFLLPLFGGIAITVLGIKVSLLLFVIVRMIVDKIGELIGTKVFAKIAEIYKFFKYVRQCLDAWKS